MAIALIGGMVLLIAGGSDDSDGGSAADVELTETVNDRGTGLSVAYPEGWKRAKGGGAIRLESPDGCAEISMSAPVPAGEAEQLRRSAIDALRSSFQQTQVRHLPRARENGMPTTGALVAARRKDGRNMVIRFTVTRGRELAHLTSVHFRRPPCEEAAPEIEAILGSIEFSR